MSAIDRAKYDAQKLAGKAAEAVGDATGDHGLRNKGKLYQGSAHVKQGLEHIKGKVTGI
ncbi:MAG: CsbD family protein [Mycobacteriaceae bacterium]